jgi:beta-glucosidase
MKKPLIYLILFVFLPGMQIDAQTKDDNALNQQVRKLVSEMTLEEKASLCSGRDPWSTKPIERLDIPWIWMADGPHGLRRAPSTDKWGYGDQLPATCFPTASALAATWDTDLIRQVGEALGKEAQAQNINILLGPGTNIKRSVLAGRNFEYFSEDPVLSGEMSAAYIDGVQSQGVGTCLKHYVANNVETNRMYVNSDVDTRTLHEIYMRPFEIAIKKSNPWSVMACYNRVQGEYGTQNHYMLQEVLNKRWNYNGIVISDWEAVVDRVEALKAGMHLQMPGHQARYNDSLIVAAVKNGELEEATLNHMVSDLLKTILKANSLEKETEMPADENHQFARQVASQGITLLKNDDQVLPIEPDKYKHVVIIGEFAENPRFQGNGSSEVKPTRVDNALEIIRNEYGENFKVSYAQGYKLSNDNDLSLVPEAQKVAAEADIALVFAGLPSHYESEGIDREHIHMPRAHEKLISSIGEVQENTVVVLTNGSAVAMPWIDQVKGVVESWLVGQAGAGGVADVLFGKVNPSGKLAETFPMRLEDTPAYLNFPGEQGEVLYGERMFVGYRYYDARNIEPLFPFGYGLSYTNFDYSNLEVSDQTITDQERLSVRVDITNTGERQGKEVVQLYVSDQESRLQRPEKELKAFAKVDLQPGETQTVSFTLDSRDFSFYDPKREMWIAQSGKFDIRVGSSSRNIHQTETIQLNSTQQVPLTFDEYTFFIDYWENEQTREYIKELIPQWLEANTPEGQSLDEVTFDAFMAYQPIIKFPYFTGGEITREEVMELVEKCQGLTYQP